MLWVLCFSQWPPLSPSSSATKLWSAFWASLLVIIVFSLIFINQCIHQQGWFNQHCPHNRVSGSSTQILNELNGNYLLKTETIVTVQFLFTHSLFDCDVSSHNTNKLAYDGYVLHTLCCSTPRFLWGQIHWHQNCDALWHSQWRLHWTSQPQPWFQFHWILSGFILFSIFYYIIIPSCYKRFQCWLFEVIRYLFSLIKVSSSCKDGNPSEGEYFPALCPSELCPQFLTKI